MIPSAEQAHLADELRNFEQIAKVLKPSPGAFPVLPGIDIHGVSMPLKGAVGGDHVIYIDFKKRYDLDRRIREATAADRTEVAEMLRRCKRRGGVLLTDVSGHKITDALIAAMLHQAFLLGVYYELDRFGEITTKLFEHINQRFYKTTTVDKYLTMLYGEISERGSFRFVSAGHPLPAVFSRRAGRFITPPGTPARTSPPVGMFPSNADPDERVAPGALGYKERYSVNQLDSLEPGDLLILHTDGLSEHADGDYFPKEAEKLLAKAHNSSAEEICRRLSENLASFAPPQDDVTLVVIKRSSSAE